MTLPDSDYEGDEDSDGEDAPMYITEVEYKEYVD